MTTELLEAPIVSTRTRPKRPMCLFQSGSEAYAVSLEKVAEVVEVERLVRVPHSPPRIIALCTLRREVIPVVDLNDSPSATETAELSTKTIVLLLRTSRGIWGVPVSAEGTIVSEESMDEPGLGNRATPRGSRIGTLRKGSTTYNVIDPEATWHEIRRSVEAWYHDQWGGESAPSNLASLSRTSP